MRAFFISNQAKKRKIFKEITNFIQTDIHLILNPLRTFAVKQILYIYGR